MDLFFEDVKILFCREISIGHSQCEVDDEKGQAGYYNRRRFQTEEDKLVLHQNVLFRRNLQCYGQPR